MNSKTIKNLLVCSLLSISSQVIAQDAPAVATAPVAKVKTSSLFRTMSFGVNGGVLMANSIVKPADDFSNFSNQVGYGFFLKKQVGHTLGFQADFLAGSVRGSDSDRRVGGINGLSKQAGSGRLFETNINWSASFSPIITLGNISFLKTKAKVLPYVGAGFGVIDYTSVLWKTKFPMSSINVKGPSVTNRMFFIPAQIGTKVTLSSVMNLDLGYKVAFVGSDTFDGNPYKNNSNDQFSYGYIGLEFALGKKSKPQLATHNPITAIVDGFQVKYDDLKKQLEDEKAKMAVESARLNAENARLSDEQKKLTTDTDGDGVSNFFDKCISTPSGDKVDGAGCTLVTPPTTTNNITKIKINNEDKRVILNAIKNLQFATGKAVILASSYPSLDRVAGVLVAKNYTLKLAGHTDNVGTPAANLSLSKDRAEAVKTYLVSKGANPSKIEATGYGQTQPIASNKTKLGKQKNRRVEFTIY